MVALGSVHSRYLEGSFPAGESCGALLGLVLAVGLGPDPGSPSAFDTGALVFGCGHSCMYLSEAWTVGNPKGFLEEGKLQLRIPGSTGSFWGSV
jgi:hypothetical protein